MTEKRRVSLPVVGQAGQPRRAVDDAELGLHDELPKARAPGAWILLGALSILATMMPLMYLAVALVGAASRARGAATPSVAWAGGAAAVVVAFSAWTGGWVVGRFGGHAGPREGALAGALAGVALWAMTRMPIGVVLVVLTIPLAWAGARFGRRTRKPGDSIGT